MNTVETFKTILSEQNLALQENRKEIEDVDLAVAILTWRILTRRMKRRLKQLVR